MVEDFQEYERREKRRRRLRFRFTRMMSDPTLLIANVAIYASIALVFLPERSWGTYFTPKYVGVVLAALAFIVFVSKYLGIFNEERFAETATIRPSSERIDRDLLREIRNYLVHAPRPSASPPTQINIDEGFKGQLIARLATESQSALSAFIESEVFKQTADARFKAQEKKQIVDDVDRMISTYQVEMASWRRNANVNLMIGLVCAVAGIGERVMTDITYENSEILFEKILGRYPELLAKLTKPGS